MEQMNFFGCETALRSRVITKQTQRESHEKVDKQVIRNNILNELSYGNMTARNQHGSRYSRTDRHVALYHKVE